jgi:TetR/AcrR family transcriptional regulator, copper-responsive repressor
MIDERKKKVRGRPKTLDRERTIETAMVCYWREGVDALGLNEICRRAGISKPMLYREFGGEDGLMAAALEQYRQAMALPVLALLATDRPFAEVLGEIIHAYTADRGTPAGCLFTKMRSSPSRLGPVTTARVAALRDELREAYAAWYERARSRDEVNVTVPAELAAHYLDTQLTTMLVQMAAGQAPDLVRAQAQLAFAGLLRA